MSDVPRQPAPSSSGVAPPSRQEGQARVVDLRTWHEAPGMRRLRPPRALWGRAPVSEPPPTIAPVVQPVVRAPIAAPQPDVAAVPGLAGPLLIVTCAESRVVEQLRQHLPVASVLQNLGGVMPRTTRSPRVQVDVATVEEALDAMGVQHIVCVGHLGCRVADGAARFVRSGADEDALAARLRRVRAVEHHVFTQLQRVRSFLRQRAEVPTVRVSGLWVDEQTGHVHAFDPVLRRFTPLDAFDLVRYSATVPGRQRGGRQDQ